MYLACGEFMKIIEFLICLLVKAIFLISYANGLWMKVLPIIILSIVKLSLAYFNTFTNCGFIAIVDKLFFFNLLFVSIYKA